MKLVWFDDCGDSYNSLTAAWTAAGNGALSNTRAKTGAYSLGFSGTTPARIQVAGADEHATFEAGFYTYRTGTPTTVCYLYGDAGATIHLAVVVGTNLIEVRRGSAAGTVLGSYAGTVDLSVWNHIEVKCTLSDTTGAVQVWLNGASVIGPLTALDTKNGGTKTVFDSLGFGLNTGSGGSNWVDDVYLLNGATGTPDITSPLGDKRVYVLLPDADGSNKNLTGVGTVVGTGPGTYQNVDEAPAPITTDYNEAATGIDTYGFQNLATSVDATANVSGVMLVEYSQKTEAGAKFVKPVVRTGGSNYSGASRGLTQGGWTEGRTLYTRGPDGVNWTVAKVDSSEYGIEASDT